MEKLFADLPNGKRVLLGSRPQNVGIRENWVFGARAAEVLDACGVEIISVEKTPDYPEDPLTDC